MKETKTMTILFDNAEQVERADDRVILEEDENGLLYETNNASTQALVCSAMFLGWGIECEPRRSEWLEELTAMFGSREIAERYFAAATDRDK